MYDAVITSTLACTYMAIAAAKTGAVAEVGYKKKEGAWRKICREHPELTRGFTFKPLAAEFSGILHPMACQLYTQLVGETQAERRRRREAGVWMQGDKGTARLTGVAS